MSTPSPTSPTTGPSFAETALRLGGKSDEEVRSLGAVDRADEQVDLLFAPQYQTASSPVHQAIWDDKVPLDMFAPPTLPATAPCDAIMDRSLALVRERLERKTLDGQNKISAETLEVPGEAGYWGLFIDPRYGGSGAAFARFSRFLTRMGRLRFDGGGPRVGARLHAPSIRCGPSSCRAEGLLPLLASGKKLSACSNGAGCWIGPVGR